MSAPDYSEPDMAALAGIDPDPDYGRDIDDEGDRAGHLVHGLVRMFEPDLDDEDDEYGDDEEWQPGEGQCDNCGGRDVVVLGPLGPLVCACSIGQGAPLEECLCGLSEGGDQ